VQCDAASGPGPPGRRVEKRYDFVGFVRAHGLPAVLKPRRGSGSVGVRILRTAGDLSLLPAALPDHLIEEYVSGDPVHVDGLLAGGVPVFTLPAEYTEEGCLAHWSGLGSGSLLIPPDDARHDALVAALWDVVAALPPAPDLLLHAEFFVVPGRRPVLCEIASRLPGHPIPPMIDRTLGVAARDLWLAVAAGRPVAPPDRRPGLVANFGLPPRRGTLLSLPASTPVPWVHDVETLARSGEHWDDARHAACKSGDFVLTWTVTAADLPTLRARVAHSARYFAESTAWDRTDGRVA
jgi:hypothetical protein